ncbi:hypothetical protein G7Y89_g94 [Cudoniella acicularis]|uniref:Zn(2)-C6 fungal-type domain-containing protein n=1 Tax=Cudoniella acicularis TaxID=354080 RepID=A0A8H4S0J0_9HELO|nr:hypothetical protein G7Y89_g94 [Cudoniella acicularis]
MKAKANKHRKFGVENEPQFTPAAPSHSSTLNINLDKDLVREVLGAKKNFRRSDFKQAYESRGALLYHVTAPKSRCSWNYDPNTPENPISGDPSPSLAYHPNATYSQDQENQPPQAHFRSEQQVSAQVFQKRKLRPSHRLMGDETSTSQATGVYEGQSLVDTLANTDGKDSSVKEQILARKQKPDDEVSETTRKRRAAKKKKDDERKREREARKRRIEDLEANGIERPEGPCQPCKDSDIECKIPKDPTLGGSRCLRCLQKNGKYKCTFPDLEAPVLEPVVPSQERRLLNKSTPTQHQIYSLAWFRLLARTEQHRVLVELITSNIRYIESGTPRLPGPCRPCFELGLECRVIKEDSLASKLSKTKRCFNCLDDSTRHRMRSQLKKSFGCCDFPEGYISLVCAAAVPTIVLTQSATNTTSVTLKSGTAETRKTMTVPLKSADDMKTSPYGEYFRRQSRKLHEELFPNIFADDDPVRLMPSGLSDITDLAGELYQFIEDLSFAVGALHSARSSSPLPFSPASLLELNKLPIGDSRLPTIAEAIKQGLGLEGSLATVEVSDQIRRLGIDGCSLFEVVPLVTSLLLRNLIMEGHWINPFSSGGIATRTEIVLTSIRNAFPPQYLDQNWKEKVIENFHLASLSSVSLGRDPQLSKQLDGLAMAAGEKLYQILKPFLVLGLVAVAESELDLFRDICLSITGVATRLNAQLVARRETNHITLFWPYPGQKFDHTSYNSSDGSGYSVDEVRTVRIARFWGIKMRDYESDQYRTLAKSECDVF